MNFIIRLWHSFGQCNEHPCIYCVCNMGVCVWRVCIFLWSPSEHSRVMNMIILLLQHIWLGITREPYMKRVCINFGVLLVFPLSEAMQLREKKNHIHIHILTHFLDSHCYYGTSIWAFAVSFKSFCRSDTSAVAAFCFIRFDSETFVYLIWLALCMTFGRPKWFVQNEVERIVSVSVCAVWRVRHN